MAATHAVALEGGSLNQFPSLFLRAYAPFHYLEHTSCIVTTTNFLAVYKTVNQNHTGEPSAEQSHGCTSGGRHKSADRCQQVQTQREIMLLDLCDFDFKL